jgi:ParB family chromosome partitioning protein
MKIGINKISVKKRVRVQPGDLSKLKISMKKFGLINPITVDEKYRLLAGARRLETAKQLGWTEIDCRIVKVKGRLERLMIEEDENILRKEFTPEERLRIEELKRYYASNIFNRLLIIVKELFKKIAEFMRSIFSRIFRRGL